jgi:hypothetical protein
LYSLSISDAAILFPSNIASYRIFKFDAGYTLEMNDPSEVGI